MDQIVIFGILIVLCGLLVFLLWRARKLSDAIEQNKSGDIHPTLQLLQQQLDNLRNQLGQSLENSSQQHQSNFLKITEQLGSRINEQNKIIAGTQETLGQRLDNAAKVVGQVHLQLGSLEQASQKIYELGKDIHSLQEILKAPKLRGNLGEFFLAELLAQIFTPDQYILQHRFQNGEVVDAAICLSSFMVPIDAKFPLENFVKHLQEENEIQKKQYRKQFVSDVKKHIDKIADKYIRPDEGTSEFALMYIPAENVYYEIIIKDEVNDGDFVLYQHAMKRKVIPVSPNNLYIYLQTILLGLKGMSIEKRAKEIMAGIHSLGLEFNKVAEAHRKIGVHLQNSRSAHEEMGSRLNHFQNKMDKMNVGEKPVEELPPVDDELLLN